MHPSAASPKFAGPAQECVGLLVAAVIDRKRVVAEFSHDLSRHYFDNTVSEAKSEYHLIFDSVGSSVTNPVEA